jgi:hypothetical protein
VRRQPDRQDQVVRVGEAHLPHRQDSAEQRDAREIRSRRLLLMNGKETDRE